MPGRRKSKKSKSNGNPSDESSPGLVVISSQQRPRISINISLLIESLVQNICAIYENDQKKATLLYKFICEKLFTMNMIDESYDMNEFEGIRAEYQRAFSTILTSALGKENTLPLRPLWTSPNLSNSHYLREFEEIEYIAGGGFGKVFRVRHKLDGVEYAVKKIPIRSEGINSVRTYLSEVKTFSSMNHANIVQYKAAWLEPGVPRVENNAISNGQNSNSSSFSSGSYEEDPECSALDENPDGYIYNHNTQHSFSENKHEDTDFEISFEHSISNSRKKTEPLHSAVAKYKRERKESQSEGAEVYSTLDLHEIRKLRSKQRTQSKWATLYIQMALCQSTLKQWLDKRNLLESECNPEVALVPLNGQIFRDNTIFEILTQLLKGLQYIHSKNNVHHDIKPSNIFIEMENCNISVQLGDFGLACPLQSARHSLAFGTKLYAAPEQLHGKCDPKSDMYSVGIVLYELVENFRTDMERVENISLLRKGHLPLKISQYHPQIATFIKQLMSKKPDDRPTASNLLNIIELKSSESQQIDDLRSQLAERDEEIQHLKELLKLHGIQNV